MLWTTLATIAGIYIVICIFLFIFQRFLIYFPDKKIILITCPILFIHSKNDKIIPYSLGYENFQKAAEPKKFLEIHGSHNDGFLASGKIYENGIREFLSQYF